MEYFVFNKYSELYKLFTKNTIIHFTIKIYEQNKLNCEQKIKM